MYHRGTSVWCDGSSDRSFRAGPSAISRSSQFSTTGVKKALVCAICLWDGVYKIR